MLRLDAVDLAAVWDRVVRGELDSNRLLPAKKVFIDLDLEPSRDVIKDRPPPCFQITRRSEHPCWWCRRPDAPLGLPEHIINDGDTTHFFVQGNFCSFNCAMAHCLAERVPEKHVLLLKRMFRVMHPGKNMGIAPHWTLLHSNGGALDDEEFDLAAHRYVRTSSLMQHPVTHEWMRYRS